MNSQTELSVVLVYVRVSFFKLAHNGLRLGEVAEYGKINYQFKTKYYAKRKRQ
jgi:hypothetical protein